MTKLKNPKIHLPKFLGIAAIDNVKVALFQRRNGEQELVYSISSRYLEANAEQLTHSSMFEGVQNQNAYRKAIQALRRGTRAKLAFVEAGGQCAGRIIARGPLKSGCFSGIAGIMPTVANDISPTMHTSYADTNVKIVWVCRPS